MEALKEELESLRRKAFQVVSTPRVDRGALNQAEGHPGAHSERSGLLLRKLLGPLPLSPRALVTTIGPFTKPRLHSIPWR